MNNALLAARPSNPADISFAAHCFVQDGVTVTFEFAYTPGQLGYPKRFDCEGDAIAYSRKVGRPYFRVERPKMRRVSWR